MLTGRSALVSRLKCASVRTPRGYLESAPTRSRVLTAAGSSAQPGPSEEANVDGAAQPEPRPSGSQAGQDVQGGAARVRPSRLDCSGAGDTQMQGPGVAPESSHSSGVAGSENRTGTTFSSSGAVTPESAAGSQPPLEPSASSSMAAGSSPDLPGVQATSSSSAEPGNHMARGDGHLPPAATRPYLNGHAGPGMAQAGDAVGGGAAAADDRPGMGPSSLPPLRLDFLDLWAKMQLPQQDGNAFGGSGWQVGQPPPSTTSPFSSPSPRSSRQGGNTPGGGGATGRNARMGSSGAAGGRRRREPVTRSRDDRARQLVLAAKTLVQLRLVVERHLPDMGPGTAALALSRLAGLAAATQRLRRAQLQQQEQEQEQPASTEVRQGAPPEQQPTKQGQASGGEPTSPTASTVSGSEGAPTSSAPALVPGAPTASADVRLPPGTLRVELPLAGQPLAASSSGGSSSSGSPSATMSASLDDDDSDIDTVDGTGAAGGGGGRGRAAADGGARVPRSSLRLMRRMLYHIAACVAPDLYTSPPSPQDTSSSASTSMSSPVASASTACTATSSSVYTGGANKGSSRGASRFSPPEHRAKLAGSVLAALARVGLRPDAEDSRALGALLEASRPDLFLANPAQLCRLASSLPLLRLAPSARWLDHFTAVSRSKMYAASPLQLAAYVWALARLGYHPGDLWLYSLTQQLSRDGRLAAASAGQLCEVLWALHRLGFSPDADWRAQASAAVAEVLARDVRSGSGGSGGAGWGRSSGAPADVDVDDAAAQDGPPVVAAGAGGTGRGSQAAPMSGSLPGARGAAAAGSTSQWPTGGSAGAVSGIFGAGGNTVAEMCSLLLWAVRTGTAPAPAAMESCLDRLQPHLRGLRRVHLLRLLLALAESGHRPREELMARVLGCLQPKLASMSATHLTQALVSISQLRFVPPQAWLMAFLRASRAQLRHYTPAHVTATYQVFAGWQLRPPRSYLEALHSYMDGLLPGFNAKGLATVLQSMSALGVKPQRRWLLRALEALAECGARGIAAGSGAVLAEQFRSGPQSQAPVVAMGVPELFAEDVALVAATRAGLSAAQQQHQMRQQQRAALAASLVTAICSLRGVVQLEAQLQPHVQQEISNAVEEAAGGKATAADADGGREARAGVTESAAAVTESEGQASAAAGAPLLLPYELWPGCKAVTDVCRELLDVMSGPQLARLVNALARINFYPGREFLAAHSRATARAGAQLLPEDKEAVAGCYSRLAALAPLMAAEARRQAELRQARTAVLVPDPWAGAP